ncbi:RHS repeat-associated core domain-containing protein [Xenorhabdus nematophila]|uniref:RHS repeat-associated core domain-containing protein n=1 Tax=Xenorhabdus nematophila TaxID=628 RepID=UPI0003275801|nr:RHS repeat-associated core domain-containing protein [Xenorhabdus nematophila]CCW32401.1 C component of insecticidal toxin complex (Tc) [Xenorhabdus nematophila F1]
MSDTFSLYTGTPEVTVYDNRALTVRTLQFCRTKAGETPDLRCTRTTFSETGYPLTQADPRLGAAGLTNFNNTLGLVGQHLHQHGADNGDTWALADILNRPLWQRSANGQVTLFTHDALGRLVTTASRDTGTPDGTLSTPVVRTRTYYGETLSPGLMPREQAKTANLCGQAVMMWDSIGLESTAAISLTGQIQTATRRLLAKDKEDREGDWSGNDTLTTIWQTWETALDPVHHVTRYRHNAHGQVVSLIDAAGHTRTSAYDVSGILCHQSLTLAGQTTAQVILQGQTVTAAGQPLSETQGNGVTVNYDYEPETQRLIGTTVSRERDGKSTVLQALRYTHDPAGNVLTVTDEVPPVTWFRNQQVNPVQTFSYDSLYQLVCAKGREAATQQQGMGLPALITPQSANSSQYTNYTRCYTYDRGGNLTQIRHSAPKSGNNWTTDIAISTTANRGVSTALFTDITPQNPEQVDTLFDRAGNQLQLQPGQVLKWDRDNRLHQVTATAGISVPREYYGYSGARRVLKASEQPLSEVIQQQRVIYLDGLEQRTTQQCPVTRQEDRAGVCAAPVVTEALEIIITDTGASGVRVFHWTAGKPDGVLNDSIRYSYGDQIGSGHLELDQNGDLISREEYYPYGGTALWATRSQMEADYKTVRYSGKERDATGLYYYGYRYYQPWAGRWLNPDPAGTVDGPNLFRMVRNNPVSAFDNSGLMFARAVFKVVTSAGVAAGGLGYEAYKHANKPADAPAVEQLSISTLGNNKIHDQHVKIAERQHNFSLLDTVRKNLSGRGKVLSDAARGQLPAHESAMNEAGNIAAIYEFSKTGSISQLDKTSLMGHAVQDIKGNIPTRIKQTAKTLATVGTITPEGGKELAETAKKTAEVIEDTAIVGVSIGVAGNTALTAAKLLVPGAAIPLTIAQSLWAVSSVGKVVNDVNEVTKTHIEKSEITHHTRTDLLSQIKQINTENRKEIIFGRKE